MAAHSRRAAVLGSPISHSRSPALHRAAYRALGLDWSYDAIDIGSDRLADFVRGCAFPAWAGLSLTMPLKTDILPLLDEASETALLVRAANTVVFTERGRCGHNTDVPGMEQALREAHGADLSPRRGAIIGSGATARSAMAALARLGADEVVVIARNAERAGELRGLGSDLGVTVSVSAWDGSEPIDADAVIATVPPGAADSLVGRVPPVGAGALLDVAYGHGTSDLARAWAHAGGAVAEGLDLLLWQAVDQVRLMTGMEPPVDAMRAALAEARA